MRRLCWCLVAGLALVGCDNNNVTTPSTDNTGARDATGNPVAPTPETHPGGTSTDSANSDATRPDNTGVNERDRPGNTQTPIDQKEDSTDVKWTAEIRQKIVNADNPAMSINARNVKIITENNKVTLRGPVASQEEKDRIEKFAKETAGDGNVVNEIEVAP
jgi:hyperosmotically inducible periplasmic protein